MSKIKPNFGVLILGYNRPGFLTQTLKQLQENTDLSETQMFFSLDGPRFENDLHLVRRCEEIFSRYGASCAFVEHYYSELNLGLRRKVIASVTEALKTTDRLLVLEDDCLLGESSLQFYNWAFERLASITEAGTISGTYFGPSRGKKAFLADRFSSWGWAIDKETWNGFITSKFAKVPLQSLTKELRTLTDSVPSPYGLEYRKISRNLNRLDSWAIPFDLFLRSEHLKTIKPTVNQIRNIGFGESATHTQKGFSLSIGTGYFDAEGATLVDARESRLLETVEAWYKSARLFREVITPRKT